jgi:transcriptional regulator
MKTRFTEEQIVKILNRHSRGETAKGISRELGVVRRLVEIQKPSGGLC